MGQQIHTQPFKKKLSDLQIGSKIQSSDRSNVDLLTISSGEHKKQDTDSISLQSLQNAELGYMALQQNKEYLQRLELLIQFIGEIIYYCKLNMKKQRKYHYKISALLFYKYFYDKFRQLLSKYLGLYQRQEISRQDYEKKVKLVYQVKDTFIKIKKFIYGKIPFLTEKIKSFLNEESEDYCFSKKQFFTDLLYPEVKQIMQTYQQQTDNQFDEPGINACYIRMIKAIFIIEELEFFKPIVQLKDKNALPNYEIDKVQAGTEEQIRLNLIQSYKLFLTIKRS